METKTYRVTNKQPGPRGVQTADGVVMVAPTAPGTESAVEATFTKDEAKAAKAVGLKLKEVKPGQLVNGTDDLPAEGHVNLNHPDAAKVLGLDEDGEAADEDDDDAEESASAPAPKPAEAKPAAKTS